MVLCTHPQFLSKRILEFKVKRSLVFYLEWTKPSESSQVLFSLGISSLDSAVPKSSVSVQVMSDCISQCVCHLAGLKGEGDTRLPRQPVSGMSPSQLCVILSPHIPKCQCLHCLLGRSPVLASPPSRTHFRDRKAKCSHPQEKLCFLLGSLVFAVGQPFA